MHALLERLAGGDRRSIGAADEVVKAVRRRPALFGVVMRGLFSSDPQV